MKKIVLIIAICIFVLCGCSKNGDDKQVYAPTTDTDILEQKQTGSEAEDTTGKADVTENIETSETVSEVTESESETSIPDETKEEPKEEPTKNENVSPLAEERFMEPFDNYSWEKKYDTEYIVLHFASNVVNNRTDPYILEEVVGTFVEGQASVHYIIDREGNIYCLIPENRSAWHAGAGTYANDEKYTNNMNRYSIGIELMGIGSEKDMSIYFTPEEYNALDKSLIGFTDEQYASLIELLKDICERNSIEYCRERIIGHSEFNPKKNDPGELFMWDRLFE